MLHKIRLDPRLLIGLFALVLFFGALVVGVLMRLRRGEDEFAPSLLERPGNTQSHSPPPRDPGRSSVSSSMRQKNTSKRLAVALFVLLFLCVVGGGYHFWRASRSASNPASATYRDAVRAFYVGLAAMQVGDNERAQKRLEETVELASQEPAGWANLGLLHLRANRYEPAAEHLQKAHSLAPDSSRIAEMLAILESKQGNSAKAIAHFRRAIELDGTNLKARYALAQEIERRGEPASEPDALRQYEAILKLRPDNLAARLEFLRLSAKVGNARQVQQDIVRLSENTVAWDPQAREQLKVLQSTVAGDPRAAAIQVVLLSNLLKPLPAYQESLGALSSGGAEVGEPLQQFLVLPAPNAAPAPPDTALNFTAEPLPGASAVPSPPLDLQAVPLASEGDTVLLLAAGEAAYHIGTPSVPLTFPNGIQTTPHPHAILALDWNYDFKTDLVLAGAGGLRLFEQNAAGAFQDVTARPGLPPGIATNSYAGAWAADIEADGDLDIVLAQGQGPTLVLRNNGDRTFLQLRPFGGVSGLRQFAWADFDQDGDVDAAFLDRAGVLQAFENQRSGVFRAWRLPQELGTIAAIHEGDIANRGVLDLVALTTNGRVLRLAHNSENSNWDIAEVARQAEGLPRNAALAAESARLFVADLDNNGGLDLVVSVERESRIWLSGITSTLAPLPAAISAGVYDVADLNGDGRLDMLGIDSQNRAVRLINKGTKDYHWQVLRARAAEHVSGDQRINSFGIGGEMELRAGLVLQRRAITGPSIHFGLGEQKEADVARILWPNGAPQAEFELKAGKPLLAVQRLTGSCPFLFAWDGKTMRFVKDCNWRSPLGLKINGQDTAGVMQTADWVKVRGDQLVPRNGVYELRVTADLWEAHFFDLVSLLVVDHPANSEVWADERFSIPMPPLKVHATTLSRPFQSAHDDTGQDVSQIVRRQDARYLDTFGRGRYQGITRDHYVELELPEDAPRTGPLYLIATGWLHPTDSSINVAISQGKHDPPRGLSLEVFDPRQSDDWKTARSGSRKRAGGWTPARSNLGFPAGKNKTVLLDLTGIFRPGTPRRLRLRTNLEIYWDALEWAVSTPQQTLRQQNLTPRVADLRYRGFSDIRTQDASSPEVPRSYEVRGTAPMWRDLMGFYTRFGDVRELAARVDDRYVIMNAGDEMVLRFTAPPPPPSGWKRDFVFISDGWTKDGNLNTLYSKTLLPLPSHDRPEYTAPPVRLQDDPVYRRFPADWQKYHTRYVSPRRFRDALRLETENVGFNQSAGG